jgi:hypothetical protein
MVTVNKTLETKTQISNPSRLQQTKHGRIIAKTFKNNTDSDYTEKIAELNKNFNYNSDKNHYWSKPEQSLLYGTPLYEVASPTQKLALNHLHWFFTYDYVSDSESETAFFNQVTSSVFDTISGYKVLSSELAFETEQEYSHIHAFRKVGLKTATALMGKQTLKALFKLKSYKPILEKDSLETVKYYGLRFIAKGALRSAKQHYSPYLHELEENNNFIIKSSTAGMLGRSLEYSPSMESFLSFNWGSGSPFMACHFYALRIIANLYLKNVEHPIAKYYKTLENKGAFIPTPTAISRNHFLDEAFHTTISQLIAKEVYKDFAKPTAYEKFIANLAILMMQRGTVGAISGVLPHRYFADDYLLMELIYRLLQTPLFGISAQEALHWMKRCFCYEHEGFHWSYKNHQRLISDMRDFFEDVDYLWPINREMRLMAARGSISKAIQNNIKTFKHFLGSAT